MPYVVIWCSLLLVWLLWQTKRHRAAVMMQLRRLRKKRLEKENFTMSSVMDRFLGKDCLIYFSMGSGQVSGVIESVEDNWLVIRTLAGQTDVVSLDYVNRVREYPLDKHGKRKSVVLD